LQDGVPADIVWQREPVLPQEVQNQEIVQPVVGVKRQSDVEEQI